MIGLHKHILDYEILETNNAQTLLFVDSSQYMDIPDSPMLEVTPPGYSEFFLVNYVNGKVNTFNSSTIGFGEVLNQSCLTDLPDGLWTIKQKICPYKYVFIVKRFMRVTQLLLKIKSLYEKLTANDILENKRFQNDIISIYILIEGAKALANYDSIKATDNYKLANELVENQLKKFCKNCG